MQQIKAILEGVGSSFCPDHSDWLGTGAGDAHSRNADNKLVLSKLLQSHAADFSTTKLQVSLVFISNFIRKTLPSMKYNF